MSNATCASPIASSQLFFAWSEQAEVAQPVVPAPAVLDVPAVADFPAVADVPAPRASAVATPPVASSGETGYLSFTHNARIAKPVRMGAVMIKLLKRYGITDQEIAEGVANYARKHQKALAG